MELKEIMRLIWQGLSNLPMDVPEREETIRAYGALESRLGFKPPEWVLEIGPTDYYVLRAAGEQLGPEGAPSRPFPQTYNDWVRFAEDIKAKDPSVGTSWEVNHALNAILEEERGEAEPDADYTAKDAKRWLLEKIGEQSTS